jgi:hypothetical protein
VCRAGAARERRAVDADASGPQEIAADEFDCGLPRVDDRSVAIDRSEGERLPDTSADDFQWPPPRAAIDRMIVPMEAVADGTALQRRPSDAPVAPDAPMTESIAALDISTPGIEDTFPLETSIEPAVLAPELESAGDDRPVQAASWSEVAWAHPVAPAGLDFAGELESASRLADLIQPGPPAITSHAPQPPADTPLPQPAVSLSADTLQQRSDSSRPLDAGLEPSRPPRVAPAKEVPAPAAMMFDSVPTPLTSSAAPARTISSRGFDWGPREWQPGLVEPSDILESPAGDRRPAIRNRQPLVARTPVIRVAALVAVVALAIALPWFLLVRSGDTDLVGAPTTDVPAVAERAPTPVAAPPASAPPAANDEIAADAGVADASSDETSPPAADEIASISPAPSPVDVAPAADAETSRNREPTTAAARDAAPPVENPVSRSDVASRAAPRDPAPPAAVSTPPPSRRAEPTREKPVARLDVPPPAPAASPATTTSPSGAAPAEPPSLIADDPIVVTPPLTPAAPVAAAPPPPPPATASATAATEEQLVSATLRRYAMAYQQLDASAARKVWPAVDERALAKAFQALESQQVSFDQCRVSVAGQRARADCAGRVTYVPKVGNKDARTIARRWDFALQKRSDAWHITDATIR